MDKIDHRIGNIFGSSVDNIQASIFFNQSEYTDFQCLFSSSSQFQALTEYELYSLYPLMRLLIKRNQVLDSENLQLLYPEDGTQLCYIHEWSVQTKKVFIFDLKNATQFDNEKFAKALNEGRDEFEKIYQIAFIKIMESK